MRILNSDFIQAQTQLKNKEAAKVATKVATN